MRAPESRWVSDEDFRGGGVPEECGRAGGEPVRPAWKITMRSSISAGGRSMSSPSRSSGRAEAADDGDRAPPRSTSARLPTTSGIVAADGLAEVAGCRELVVHSAVDDEVGLAARHLAIEHPGHVDPALARRCSGRARSPGSPRGTAAAIGTVHQVVELLGDGVQVERLVPSRCRGCRTRRPG